MRYKKIFNLKSLSAAIIAGMGISFASCVDDNFDINNGKGENEAPWNDKNLACVPIGISFEASSTRTSGDTIYGSAEEHEIDFTTQHECYAIFFYTPKGSNQKEVKYIHSLYFDKQITDTYQPNSTDLGEYTVFAVAYVPKEDVKLSDEEYEDEDEEERAKKQKEKELPKISDVLVVLNGGKLYKKFHELIYTKNEKGEDVVKSGITPDQVLALTWDYPMVEHRHDFNPDTPEDPNLQPPNSDGEIGFNSKGLFTMTNSAYFDKDGKLMTLTPLQGPYFVSVMDYLNQEKPTPNAEVQVERMVAKVTEPLLSTEIYGSEHFFRPSDNVPHLVVYDWIGEKKHSQEIDWRIHLTGWTINGGETQSFIFKNIEDKEYKDFNVWNKIELKRSFWSIDPHYDLTPRVDGDKTYLDFYPWQYRLAANIDKTVSWQAGTSQGYTPVLHYNKFSEVTWKDVRYVSENTFDPQEKWDLDGRTDLLAGPHLLLTGEIYLKDQVPENPNDQYLSFGRVPHLYRDRIQRYYRNEIDFFKMFITEFQNSITTQWSMTFNLMDWDDPTHKISSKYRAVPGGNYKIYYRCPINEFERLKEGTEEEKAIYNKIQQESHWYYADYAEDLVNGANEADDVIDNKSGYVYREITFSLIDGLLMLYKDQENAGLFSDEALTYQGDGRIIPWLANLHIRKPDMEWTKNSVSGSSTDEYDPKRPLKQLDFVWVDEEGSQNMDNVEGFDLRTNLYKSFIREWWGPIDHYNGGRLYYAGSIKHQNGKDDHLLTYYGTVRNHWYKLTISAINGIGTPVSDPEQLIIPDKYAYKDQIGVYTEIVGWHLKDTQINFSD